MNLGTQVNKKKIGELLIYITTQIQDVNLRKMLKLIYLIDECAVREKVLPITWLEYKAWAKGPVAEDLYNIKNNDENIFSEYVYAVKSASNQNIIKPKRTYNSDCFSNVELNIINSVLSEYKACSDDELSEMTHSDDRIWKQVVAENNIIFTDKITRSDYVVDFRLMLSYDDKLYFEDALENMKLCSFLNS